MLGFSRAITAAAAAFGIEATPAGIGNASELEHVVDDFARGQNGGLILLPSSVGPLYRDLIIALAARHHLPAIYSFRYFPEHGGLCSYGIDTKDLYRRAASYVDRILKGEKPADLPVQAPTKFELEHIPLDLNRGDSLSGLVERVYRH